MRTIISFVRKSVTYLRFFLHIKTVKSFLEYNRKADESRKAKISDILPIYGEATKTTAFDAHYVYHPAWAMRIVKEINPNKHIDISSTLHFCTSLSAFVPTEFYDYRPAFLNLSNLSTGKGDLTKLDFANNSVESMSCMHTIEHIGLGRYGDEIDPYGDEKACKELTRVLQKDGNLLFVTPVGKPRVMFNGHRVYSFEQIVNLFKGLKLQEFSLIPDDAVEKGIIINAPAELVEKQNYGCGCFWFKKL